MANWDPQVNEYQLHQHGEGWDDFGETCGKCAGARIHPLVCLVFKNVMMKMSVPHILCGVTCQSSRSFFFSMPIFASTPLAVL